MTDDERFDLAEQVWNLTHKLCGELRPRDATVHQCPCDRTGARGGLCWRCQIAAIRALLDEMEATL